MSTRTRTAGASGKVIAKTARKTPAAKAAPRRRAKAGKPFELILLGATGYTGRQALRAVLTQRPDARLAVAGRDAARLHSLLAQMVPPGGRAPEILVADTRDADSLHALARQGQVLFNLAGPYHATGDAVVAACIAGRHALPGPVGRDLLDPAAGARAARGRRACRRQGHALRRLRGAALRPGHAVGRAPVARPCRRALRQREDRRHDHRPSGHRPARPGQRRHRGQCHRVAGARPQRLPARHGLPAAARVAGA